ncbi:hypothetical protein FHS53_003140 [Xanthobacter tagetidis]|nr:hypothetical protein [Xanthobacter tagetidis]
MPGKYDDFVRRANIKIFEKRLQTETDPGVRSILVRLLFQYKIDKIPDIKYNLTDINIVQK